MKTAILSFPMKSFRFFKFLICNLLKIKIVTPICLLFQIVLQANAQAPAQPTMGELIGINSRISDPLVWQKKFGFVREYHEWANDINYDSDHAAGSPAQKYRWNPNYDIVNTRLGFDEYYSGLAGKVVPVTKGLAPEMRGYMFYPWCPELLEQKPICANINYSWDFNCPPGGSYSTLPDFGWLSSAALENHQNPALYVDHAKWNTLLAARYGLGYSGYLKDYPVLQIAEPFYPFPRLEYIETGNEPEKSWYDTAHGLEAEVASLSGNTYWQMTAPQYAAQLSADFDGHGQSSGLAVPSMGDKYFGIANCAPRTKTVLAGLADLRVGYIKAMKTWFVENRTPGVQGFVSGPLYPFDVLNFHHFSSSNNRSLSQIFSYEDISGNPLEGSQYAICPECDDLRGDLSAMLDEINNIDPVLGEKEVWLSEFGYDAQYGPGQTSSGMRIAISDPVKRQLRQAQWLVRSFLEISAAKGAGHYIHKAMAFDLRDNAPKGYDGGLFDHCGLLSNDFQPKRAWYYVQTLRNVLKDYRFKQDLGQLNFDEGPAIRNSCNIPSMNLRAYQFEHKDDPGKTIIAIWRWSDNPGQILNNTSCNLAIHRNIFGENTQATRIEFVNLDENGRKYAQQVTANGAYLELFFNKNLGETPVFIIPGAARQDPETPLVSQLNATTVCCGAVQLSWSPPVQSPNASNAGYLIYFSDDEMLVNEPAKFEMNRAVYFNKTWQNSAVIPGLTSGMMYRFFVIPVDNYGNIPDLSQPGVLSQLSVKYTVADFDCPENTCQNPSSSCLLQLSDSVNGGCFRAGYAPVDTYTCYDNGGNPLAINMYDRVRETFGLQDPPGGRCEPLHEAYSPGCPGNGWMVYDYEHPANNYVEINLPAGRSVELNTIYLYDIQGVGNIVVEYRNCICGEWRPFTTIKTDKYNEWVAIYDLPAIPVNALRFTKTSDQANVARIYLCTTPSSCSQTMNGFLPGYFTGLTVQDIQSHTVEIQWNALIFNRNDPQSTLADGYTVRYSTQTDTAGNLINPVVRELAANQYENMVNYRIGGLEPLTTYYAEVEGVRLPPNEPCDVPFQSGKSNTFPKQKISFTTPGEIQMNRERNAVPQHARLGQTMEIHPNPGTGLLTVQLPSMDFSEMQVYNAQGGLVKTLPINIQDNLISLNLEQLPAGVYTLAARNVNGTVVHARYVKR